MEWYYERDGVRLGPVTQDQILRYLKNGTITPDTMVWNNSMPNWESARRTPLLSGGVPGPSDFGGAYGGFVHPGPSTYSTGVSPWPGGYRPEGHAIHLQPLPRCSFPLYLAINIISSVLLALGVALALSNNGNGSNAVAFSAFFFLALSASGFIWALVLSVVYLYRGWLILERHAVARHTPGTATGLLFVPLFNYYWVFEAVYAWARTYNELGRNRGFPPVPDAVFLAFSVLFCAWPLIALAFLLIPGFYLAYILAEIILRFLVVFQICKTVNQHAT